MRTLILLLALAGLFAFLLANKIPDNCLRIEGSTTVSIKDDSFSPNPLTIKKCTKVIFKNDSSSSAWPASDLHPTHGIYPEFDPKEGYSPGKSWSFIFNRIGKWPYHDHLNPSTHGKIIVNP